MAEQQPDLQLPLYSASVQAAGPRPSSSLPRLLTSFVGRERETAVIRSLLTSEDVRLVTITGPGGVGKTRVALHVAELAAGDFPGGVYFVSLAPVRDPTLVPSAIAQVLDIRETGHQSLVERIALALSSQPVLLLLDNFEHVIDAAPMVTGLLVACRQLRCLVTSRAVLRVHGEHAFPLPPLPLPPAATEVTAERANVSSAVQLFVARARSIRPDFTLNDTTAGPVEAVCRRLDGLPLAIELAAARVRHMTPIELAAHLSSDQAVVLPVLTRGPRDAPLRQQTLRDTIAWSHDLLSPFEQALFRRLAVFVGGFTRESAIAVAHTSGGSTLEIEDGIAALVDNSLLHQVEGSGSPRYSMLETIREFGLEMLTAAGELDSIRRLHAAHFLELAERLSPVLLAETQGEALSRFHAEYANVRAALAWLDREGAVDELARLCWALIFYWWYQGHFAEAQLWLARALHGIGTSQPALRGWLLFGSAMIAMILGREEDQELYAAGALDVAQQASQPAIEGMALMVHAWTALQRGQAADAIRLGYLAVEKLRASQDVTWLANGLGDIGLVIAKAGDKQRGIALIEEALALDRMRGNQYFAAVRLSDLGVAAHDTGNVPSAIQYYAESIRLLNDVGSSWYLSSPLAGLAAAVVQRDPIRATRLLGAAEAFRERSGASVWPTEIQRDEHAVGIARALLGPVEFAHEYAAGRLMSVASAIAEAETVLANLFSPRTQAGSSPSGLTDREREVLRLLVAGLTDRDIANTLFISPRTASKHVASILAKLGVANRSEAAVLAVRDRLI